jgi:hypothetical protein
MDDISSAWQLFPGCVVLEIIDEVSERRLLFRLIIPWLGISEIDIGTLRN